MLKRTHTVQKHGPGTKIPKYCTFTYNVFLASPPLAPLAVPAAVFFRAITDLVK